MTRSERWRVGRFKSLRTTTSPPRSPPPTGAPAHAAATVATRQRRWRIAPARLAWCATPAASAASRRGRYVAQQRRERGQLFGSLCDDPHRGDHSLGLREQYGQEGQRREGGVHPCACHPIPGHHGRSPPRRAGLVAAACARPGTASARRHARSRTAIEFFGAETFRESVFPGDYFERPRDLVV